MPKVMEVSSCGGAGGGQDAQGSIPDDTWGRGRLDLVGYYLGCGGREGVALAVQLSHDSLRPHFCRGRD